MRLSCWLGGHATSNRQKKLDNMRISKIAGIAIAHKLCFDQDGGSSRCFVWSCGWNLTRFFLEIVSHILIHCACMVAFQTSPTSTRGWHFVLPDPWIVTCLNLARRDTDTLQHSQWVTLSLAMQRKPLWFLKSDLEYTFQRGRCMEKHPQHHHFYGCSKLSPVMVGWWHWVAYIKH